MRRIVLEPTTIEIDGLWTARYEVIDLEATGSTEREAIEALVQSFAVWRTVPENVAALRSSALGDAGLSAEGADEAMRQALASDEGDPGAGR